MLNFVIKSDLICLNICGAFSRSLLTRKSLSFRIEDNVKGRL